MVISIQTHVLDTKELEISRVKHRERAVAELPTFRRIFRLGAVGERWRRGAFADRRWGSISSLWSGINIWSGSKTGGSPGRGLFQVRFIIICSTVIYDVLGCPFWVHKIYEFSTIILVESSFFYLNDGLIILLTPWSNISSFLFFFLWVMSDGFLSSMDLKACFYEVI